LGGKAMRGYPMDASNCHLFTEISVADHLESALPQVHASRERHQKRTTPHCKSP
jgi:hypothetical protein